MSGNNWSKKDIILFDLDGTLTDPGTGITHSIMYALDKFGIRVKAADSLYSFIGPPLHESFQKYYGFNSEQTSRAIEAYREYFGKKGVYENELYEGIQQLLEALKARGKIIGLATSKPEVYAESILKHFNIAQYFDILSGSLLNGERTDKAEVIAWALKLVSEKYDMARPHVKALMVGDREHDVKGAVKNHMPSIGVLFGYGSYEELKKAGAGDFARNVEELYRLLTDEDYPGGMQ